MKLLKFLYYRAQQFFCEQIAETYELRGNPFDARKLEMKAAYYKDRIKQL